MTPTELRDALDQLGWSWADLAEPLGIDRSVAQRWRHVPPLVAAWVRASLEWHSRKPAAPANWRSAA